MSDVVELSLPVTADLVVLARLTAATVASRADFDVEEIEDLRLAVDELCVDLVRGRSEGRLELRFIREDDQIEVLGTVRSGPSGPQEGDGSGLDGELSERILDALVDEHGRESSDGKTEAWLRKRRTRQQA